MRGRRRPTLFIALIIGVISLVTYYSQSEYNPVTGETQQVGLNKKQEIALGLQARPQMVQQHGGLHPDRQARNLVAQVGRKLAANPIVQQTGFQFEFHLLADPRTVNAFALPGGQVFITYALFQRLENEAQLAGVLGHEIGHVVGRHAAERVAKQKLTQGLTGAAVLATYDPDNPSSANKAGMAMVIGNLLSMKYGRDQELESDELGVRFMLDAGYDPEALIGVMRILAEASGGGRRQPEFMSTHPNPENRVGRIREAIEKYRK